MTHPPSATSRREKRLVQATRGKHQANSAAQGAAPRARHREASHQTPPKSMTSPGRLERKTKASRLDPRDRTTIS